MRGYRAEAGWPRQAPRAEDDRGLSAAADVVAKRLAFDGLVATTAAAAIGAIGVERVRGEGGGELLRRAAGDSGRNLLACFAGRMGGGSRWWARLRPAARRECAARKGASRPFRFAPSIAGFAVATDSGEAPIEMMRVQLTGGSYWGGRGTGGGADVLGRVLAAAPGREWSRASKNATWKGFLV